MFSFFLPFSFGMLLQWHTVADGTKTPLFWLTSKQALHLHFVEQRRLHGCIRSQLRFHFQSYSHNKSAKSRNRFPLCCHKLRQDCVCLHFLESNERELAKGAGEWTNERVRKCMLLLAWYSLYPGLIYVLLLLLLSLLFVTIQDLFYLFSAAKSRKRVRLVIINWKETEILIKNYRSNGIVVCEKKERTGERERKMLPIWQKWNAMETNK